MSLLVVIVGLFLLALALLAAWGIFLLVMRALFHVCLAIGNAIAWLLKTVFWS